MPSDPLTHLPLIGETMALTCALMWAFSVILFKRAELAADVSPQGLNLFKNVLALALLATTMLVLGRAIDTGRSALDWAALALSGVLGIAIGDTLYFGALRRLGPGLLSVVETSFSPSVVVFATLILGEELGPWFMVGAVLILGGVLLALRGPGSGHNPRPALLKEGVLYGVGGAIIVAFGLVIAKPALERSDLIESTTVRLLAGTIAQFAWILPSRKRRRDLAILRPQPVWTSLIPASVTGSYLAMILWIGGVKYADASVAALLNQTTVVFTLGLGILVMGEPATRGRLMGGAAAMLGAAVIIATSG